MPKHNDITFGAGMAGPEYKRLTKVGFSPQQAAFLSSDSFGEPNQKRYRAARAFPRHQLEAIIDGDGSMKTLLSAKLTRNQAKLLIELDLV